MSKLHDRIPVIVDMADIDTWLAEPRSDLLRPFPGDGIQSWKVSPDVNSSHYDGADAVVPVEG